MSQFADSCEVTEQHLEEIESLFVQTAHGLTTADGKITLKTLSPSTLHFADRPQRETGHVSSGAKARTASPTTHLSASN